MAASPSSPFETMPMRTFRDVSSLSAALLALALLLASPAAQAEEAGAPEGKLEAGLVLGGHLFSSDVELGVPDLPDEAHGLKDTWLFGARVGYALTPSLAAEGELVGIPSHDDPAGNGVFVLGWRAHGLLHLPAMARVRPFLLAGVGALSTFSGGTGFGEVADDTDFVLHWGAGAKVDLTPRTSLRLDFRHLLPPSTKGKGLTSDLELLAGFSYRFGG
jgi:opacity protein-like surface antigen